MYRSEGVREREKERGRDVWAKMCGVRVFRIIMLKTELQRIPYYTHNIPIFSFQTNKNKHRLSY